MRAEDAKQRLHDLIRELHEQRLGRVIRTREFLHDGLQRPAQQALHLAKLLLLLRANPGRRHGVQGRAELLNHHGNELLHQRMRVAGGRADDLVEALVRTPCAATAPRRRAPKPSEAPARCPGSTARARRGADRYPRRRNSWWRVAAGPARLTGDVGLILQRLDELGENLRQVPLVHDGGLRRPDKLKHASDGPRGGIPDVRLLVLHGVEQEGERLRRHGRELGGVRSLEDGTERERRRLARRHSACEMLAWMKGMT